MPDATPSAPAFWEDFYSGTKKRWSGNPNKLLVEHGADLTPGTALDLGCGEGGDAIWLAERGWTVTATDIANAALTAAKAHAREAGVDAAITWERHDFAESFPDGLFDLVTASYLQSPVELPRTNILRRAAEHVAPGGRLLIIGHAGWPAFITDRPPVVDQHRAHPLIELLALPETEWTVEVAADVEWPTTAPDGTDSTRPDSVVRYRHH